MRIHVDRIFKTHRAIKTDRVFRTDRALRTDRVFRINKVFKIALALAAMTLPIAGQDAGSGISGAELTRIPISGHWPTPTCYDGNCGASEVPGQGLGEEIGWYHPDSGTFELCDWVGDRLLDCQLLPVPAALVESGQTPVVGNWTGSGWDGLGLYHPPTGGWILFELLLEDQRPWRVIRLLPIADWKGSPYGAGVVGRWCDDVDRFGLYQAASGRFELEPPCQPPILDYGAEWRQGVPLAGDWFGSGFEQPGLWLPHRGTLLLGEVLPATSYTVHAPEDPSGIPVAGIPFVGRMASGTNEWYLGFYEPEHQRLRLFVLGRDGSPGGLPIPILVDP